MTACLISAGRASSSNAVQCNRPRRWPGCTVVSTALKFSDASLRQFAGQDVYCHHGHAATLVAIGDFARQRVVNEDRRIRQGGLHGTLDGALDIATDIADDLQFAVALPRTTGAALP